MAWYTYESFPELPSARLRAYPQPQQSLPERSRSGTTWTCVTGRHRYHRQLAAAASCARVTLPTREYARILRGRVLLEDS